MDPAGVTMMDSIKIYGKTKEQFGWPDEPPEDFPSASVSNVCPPNLNQGNGTGDTESATPAAASGTVLERYFCSCSLFLLENGHLLQGGPGYPCVPALLGELTGVSELLMLPCKSTDGRSMSVFWGGLRAHSCLMRWRDG